MTQQSEGSPGDHDRYVRQSRLWLRWSRRFSARYQRLECAIVQSCREIEGLEKQHREEGKGAEEKPKAEGKRAQWRRESKELLCLAQKALDAGAIDAGWSLLEALKAQADQCKRRLRAARDVGQPFARGL